MDTVATVSDTRLRAWAILARAALTPTTTAHTLTATRSAGTDIEDAAAQIGSLAAGPGSAMSVAELADRDLDRAEQAGAWLLTRDDPAWTGLGFDDLDTRDRRYLDAPVAVWVRGTVDPVSVLTRVGVIGTRAVSPRGARITAEIAGALAGAGCAHGQRWGVRRGCARPPGRPRPRRADHARVRGRDRRCLSHRARRGVRRRRRDRRDRVGIPAARSRGSFAVARAQSTGRRDVAPARDPRGRAALGHPVHGHARPAHSVTDVLTALNETADPEPRHQRGDQPRTDTEHDRLGAAPVR